MERVTGFAVGWLVATILTYGGAQAQSTYTIRYAGIQGQDDANTKAAFVFKDEVEKESGGRIKVQVYYGQQLAGGNTVDQLRFTKLGAIEMNDAGLSQMSQDAPNFGAPTLPYLFTDVATASEALSGKAQALLAPDAERVGLKLLGFKYLGLRNLVTARKPVQSLGDLAGLKLRVVQGAVPLATYKALGANPIPMDFAEVPAGMTQGVVDGLDLPPTAAVGLKAYSYGKYYTITKTYLEAEAVVINLAFFRRLPPDLQDVVTTAAKDEIAFEWKQNARDEAKAIDFLQASGMQVFTLPSGDIDKARGLLKDVYATFASRFGPELMAALKAPVSP